MHSIFLAFLLMSAPVWPATPAPPRQSLEAQVAPLLANLPDPNAVAGVYILDLQRNQPVFQQNADQSFVPASTMKLFVMAAAVETLGADFSFETLLATDGNHLIVIGDGDPGFGDEKIQRARGRHRLADFDDWAALLRGRGLLRIPGDLILDDSIFDDQRLHSSWERSDYGKWYAAPVAGLNLNDNCLDITASPAAAPGAPCLLSVMPPTTRLKIVNRCQSGGKGEPVVHFNEAASSYIVSGRTAKNATLSPVACSDPVVLFGDSLGTVLGKHGIQFGGTIRRDRVRLPDGGMPAGITTIDRRRTSLAEVLARVGKDSQNLFAECLLKRAGREWARRNGQADARGSWPLGCAAVMETIRRAGVQTAQLVVADGSGLSRDNRCTPRQLAELVAWMNRHRNRELFLNSLSIAGEDGSMKKRLRDINGRVYCKTGTIRGVRTLAGLAESPDGRQYAFAIMFNGYKGPSTPYRGIQDRICRILSEKSASGASISAENRQR